MSFVPGFIVGRKMKNEPKSPSVIDLKITLQDLVKVPHRRGLTTLTRSLGYVVNMFH